MKRAGPEQTDPIASLLLIGKPGFITIDGLIGYAQPRISAGNISMAISHPEVATEEDARLFNYPRDADRDK